MTTNRSASLQSRLALGVVTSLCFAVGLLQPDTASADWKDDIGYTALQARIGAALEDGSGVIVAMSEVTVGDAYMPDVNNAEFQNKNFVDVTGTNNGSTGHATTSARYFFGDSTSISSGVSEIRCYGAVDWAINQSGAATGTDPAIPDYKISSHSWVATPGDISEADAAIILPHIDYMIDQHDTVVIAATNNNNVALPRLLAPSYNSIIVGRTDGLHAYGVTNGFYGAAGRVKPMIVAPQAATSRSTPIVASAAALLAEKGAGTDATRSETMRAVLLAGATKGEFNDWDRTVTRPLDEVYGAGELNIDNSYSILEGGQFSGSATQPTEVVGEDGWDYQLSFDSSGAVYYDFEVAAGRTANDLSIILTWNAEVIDADNTDNFDPSLVVADLNLRLYDSTNGFLDSIVDESLSTVDNIEHLYFEALGPGRYTIEVTGDQSRDYGIAWSSFTAVPEPGSAFLFVTACLGLGCVRRRRA